MSFILDALRKSEQERQHSHVPIVSSVPLAIAQSRPPVWVAVVIIGLCTAVAALSWLWWHERQTDSARSAGRPAAETAAQAATPPVPLRRLAEPAGGLARTDPLPAEPPRPAPGPTAPVAPEPTPAARASPAAAVPSAAPDAPVLPTRGELLAQGVNVPPLELQLHVYSDEAARRFVFVNGAKYVEGDALPGGPRVVEITPEGVRLQQSGRDFFLARN